MSLAGAAINHRIGETFDVAGCLENRRMREDRAVHSDYIIALVHHDTPPVVLQITLKLDAERSVIPRAVESAVDFAGLKDEATPLTQADDFFHPLRVAGRTHS